MKIRNLAKENPNHREDTNSIKFGIFSNRKKEKDNSENLTLIELLKTGELTLSDWIKNDQDSIQNIISTLTPEQQEVANNKLKILYDLWIEYFVQIRLMKKLNDTNYYAPHRVNEYATVLVEKFEEDIKSNSTTGNNLAFRLYSGLEKNVDFINLIISAESPFFKSEYNIHNKEFFHQAEALIRYRDYLQKIAKEGLDVEQHENPIPTSLQEFWPELVALSNNIVVVYKSLRYYYKEDSSIDYRILSVLDCSSPWGLRERILSIFEEGYEKLLKNIRNLPKTEQVEILHSLKYDTEELLEVISDGEYEEEESEYGPRKKFNFKKFNHLIYYGDKDIHFIESAETRNYLDKNLADFANAWLDGVNGVIRKIEHGLNNLHLLKHSPDMPKFDTTEVFSNIFVIEGKNSGIQGSAFHLSDTGIITCDHCIRNQETGEPFKEIEIYRGADLKKISLKILKVDKDYDIAILEPINGYSEFFSNGLVDCKTENLQRLDPIAVAGFPNYNYGDEGYLRRGEIAGFRKVHGIPHVMVSAALIAGNSGGPVMNMEGEVIGIVVTGADNFSDSETTEWHGFLPINLLKYL